MFLLRTRPKHIQGHLWHKVPAQPRAVFWDTASPGLFFGIQHLQRAQGWFLGCSISGAEPVVGAAEPTLSGLLSLKKQIKIHFKITLNAVLISSYLTANNQFPAQTLPHRAENILEMLPLDGEGSAGADEICSESSQAGAGQGLVSCWLLVHPGHNSLTQGTSSTNFPLSLHEGALRTWAQWLTCVQEERSHGREGEEDSLYITRERFNLNITEKSLSSSTMRRDCLWDFQSCV